MGAGARRALVQAADLGGVDGREHTLPLRVLRVVVALLPVLVVVVVVPVAARLVVLATALHRLGVVGLLWLVATCLSALFVSD